PGTQYAVNLSGANTFNQEIAAAIGDDDAFVKASYDSGKELYRLNYYRTSGPDTVIFYFKAGYGSSNCNNVFSTGGGATVNIASVECLNYAGNLSQANIANGHIGKYAFSLHVTRTVGAQTTSCFVPA